MLHTISKGVVVVRAEGGSPEVTDYFGMQVSCLPDAGLTPEEVMRAVVFRSWADCARADPNLTVQAFIATGSVWWGQPAAPHIIYGKADAFDAEGRPLDEDVKLCGAVTNTLVVLEYGGQEYFAMVDQPRVAAAQGNVRDNPSGMLEHGKEEVAETPEAGAKFVPKGALAEVCQELGVTLNFEDEPVDLGQAVFGNSWFLTTPGRLFEDAQFWLVRAKVSRDVLTALEGSVGGVIETAGEHERTKVHVASRVLAKVALNYYGQGGPNYRIDLKAAFSLMLYEEYQRQRAAAGTKT